MGANNVTPRPVTLEIADGVRTICIHERDDKSRYVAFMDNGDTSNTQRVSIEWNTLKAIIAFGDAVFTQ